MAIDYNFFINDQEIEEPIGYDSVEFWLNRDDKMHGMRFEVSTTSLQFYGAAADYLRDQFDSYGQKAEVTFIAYSRCNEEAEFEEIGRGRLNFGKYKETCGTECLISLPVESDTCEVVLKNRFDQKVDIDKAKGFDGETVLPEYAGLGQIKKLEAKELFVGTVGKVQLGGYSFDLHHISVGTNPTFYLRPIYERVTMNSIDTGQVDQVTNEYGNESIVDTPISPVLLFDDNITCFTGEFNVSFRLKGSYNFTISNTSILALRLMVMQTDDPTIASPNQVNHFVFNLPHGTSTASGTFDQTYTATIHIKDGYGIYPVFAVGAVGLAPGMIGFVKWDEETSVSITANKACPPTDVELSLVHETLSRATEAITDGCMRVKSSYYGRTDSEPFSFNQDGCGGLRFLTSGLKIRRAVEDNFFVSLKELIEGLQAIDNTGMGVEADPDRPGSFLLRVEDLNFFYQDEELLFHDGIPASSREADESNYYSRITVGYRKWEVAKINGLDEFNSNREYRTGLSSVSNTLDITSSLIAGGYPIEVTRQQSFADTGGADTTYDNETFILTAERGGYGIEPEQGNIEGPENIYSPETAYNFKLSPVRNLMRWYRSIINSYANVSDSQSKLFFNSGTGNLVASGSISSGSTDLNCILENQALSESQVMSTNSFSRVPDYMPLFKNETVTYEYPMSVQDYKKIKANPYGYIRYQCGNGDIQKGFIKEIKYRPVQGMANMVLKRKW